MLKAYLQSIAEGKTKGIAASCLITVLLPFSFFYWMVIKLLAFSRSAGRKRMPCKVISVGNITWGGSGRPRWWNLSRGSLRIMGAARRSFPGGTGVQLFLPREMNL